MKKSFLFVSPTAVLGGAERVMFNLIKHLLTEGHDVTLYIMSRGIQDGWEDISSYPNFKMIIKNYKSEKTSLPAFLFNLAILSHKFTFDYTFSSHSHVNGALSLLRKFKVLKTKNLISRESTVVFERYYGLPRYLFKIIYRFMYGNQDLVICQTENMKKSLLKNLGFKPAKNIQVILNPVNLEYINNQLSTESTKPFRTLIVSCGRFIPLKQFDLLIESFSKVSNDYRDIGLMLIGDGPERKNIEKIIKDSKLEDKVILTGKITNPIKWFQVADIGIITSSIEGFPNVLIEMMASGTKKIITTPCADGLKQLPYVTVTDSTSVQSIEDSLRKSLMLKEDNAIQYLEHIKNNRTMHIFWNKIESHTK